LAILFVDDRRVFVREERGAGPAVMLVHGAGMDHGVWNETAKFLVAQGRRVLMPDLPGRGESKGPALESIADMAGWLVRVIDGLGLAKPRLAGHSMGALVALEAAARLPLRIEALALLGFVPEMRVDAKLLDEARRDPDVAARRLLRAGFADGKPPLFWNLMMTAPERLRRDLAACDGYRGAAEAAWGVTCPTLLVLGEHDRLTPIAEARAFAARLANPRLAIIPGAGHVMMLEAPEATCAALLSIL